jgi:hypothetical protein
MQFLLRLMMIRDFSERFATHCRRGERCEVAIRVTDTAPGRGILGWIDGAARTILRGIEFRFHRE